MRILALGVILLTALVGCDVSAKKPISELERLEKAGALWKAYFLAEGIEEKLTRLNEVERFVAETSSEIGATRPLVLQQRFLVEGTRAELYLRQGVRAQAEMYGLKAFDVWFLFEPESPRIKSAKTTEDKLTLVVERVRELNEFAAGLVHEKR